jgi:putative membrane protein insertion efficiency factor
MSRVMSHIAASLLLGLIAFYRLAIGPWLPRRCRFEPSCSAYAREAIERHGPVRGLGLAVVRVAHCHPWHAGGHDPVPPVGAHDDVARRCA